MLGLKGMLGKVIVMIVSGGGIGVGGLSELLVRGGGQSKDKRVAEVKAGWGKEIYQKVKGIKTSEVTNGTGSGGWTWNSGSSGSGSGNGQAKYKWGGNWKYLGETGGEKYWLLKNNSECWGLVVSSKKGEQEKVKWRRIKGSIEGEECRLEVGKRRKIFEDGKWKNEENSVSLDR